MSEKHADVAVEGPSPPGAPPRITPREKEVLDLIAEGLTDQEIARRLWVSRSTVNTHQVHLREKLQVRNRTALVREAERRGLLMREPEESRILSIGAGPHLGYTPGQEVAPSPLPEQTGGKASAGGEGGTEMANPRLVFWYLAALLALNAQQSPAPAEPAQAAATSHAPAPRQAPETDGRPAGIIIRQVWVDVDDISGNVSADGRHFSFVDWQTGDLAVRELATGKQRRLTHNGSWAASGVALQSIFSPDGDRVAYSWTGKDGFDLRVVGIEGAEPRVLYRSPEVAYIHPAAWSPDGRQVLALLHRKDGTLPLVLVSVADGAVRVLRSLEGRYPSKMSTMSFSPDGRFIACDFQARKDSPARDISLLAADSGREVPLIEHPANDLSPLWSPDGKRVLFLSDRTGSFGLWAVKVADGKAEGPPELLKADLGLIHPMGFTRDGSLYYAFRWKADVYTAALDLEASRIVAPPRSASPRFVGANSRPAWSPDGRSLAYHTSDGHFLDPPLLSIRSLDSGKVRELAPRLGRIRNLQWAADGRSFLVAGTHPEKGESAFRIDARTGRVTAFPGSTKELRAPAWSRDGRTVFYVDSDPEDYYRIVARDLRTGGEQELHRGTGGVRSLALSPDGRQFAFTEEDAVAGSRAIHALPTAGGAAHELCRMRMKPSGSHGFDILMLRWTPDGRHLLFGWLVKGATELWRVPATGGEPRRLGVLPAHARHLSVHPDGRQISFHASMSDGGAGVCVMENFLPTDAADAAEGKRR